MSKTFFYDEQIRRFILQFVRMFSHYQVEFGTDRDGTTSLYTVPVRYGDSSRQAAAIMKHNSENGIPTVPLITCYVTNLTYDRDRMQQPSFVDKMHVRTRGLDENTGEFTQQQGEAYTIERPMPTPYRLEMNVDIWTSNTEQKLQLLEQILCLFNPDLEIQSTDNYIDWTSLSYVELTGQNFTSRSIPQGTEDQIDIATLNFSMPIWLSLPAKIKKLGVIRTITHGIFDNAGTVGSLDLGLLYGNRLVCTPQLRSVILLGNQAQIILSQTPTQDDIHGVTISKSPKIDPSWRATISNFGRLIGQNQATLNNGTSQLRFTQPSGKEVIGTVAHHPTDEDILIFNVDADTIPSNTLGTVNAIINPQKKGPGVSLPASAEGQRYLLVADIGDLKNTDGADAWKGTNNEELVASSNDIVQYSNGKWQIVFDASTKDETIEYLTNSNTGIQYKWEKTKWVKSFEGEYQPGQWRLVL